MLKEITIYTDGACRGNPGPGGWGAVLTYGAHQKKINGFEAETTNNRMELMAVIQAIQHLKEPCKIHLYTDSKYVQQGMLSWLANWKKNNWKNSQKQAVKNQDLWQMLDEVSQKHDINWHWVKGHAGDPMNELVDELARQEIETNYGQV
jgi:ribonuclease HI